MNLIEFLLIHKSATIKLYSLLKKNHH